MIKVFLAQVSELAVPLALAANTAAQAPADPVRLVKVFIGSGSGPIVTPPFGMADWTAQTRQNRVSTVSYKYEDTSISGFICRWCQVDPSRGHLLQRSGRL